MTTRVLVVEDDPQVALVVTRALESDGCQVEVAVTGADALARAMVVDFDVIVLDVGIPAPDGLEVCRVLRRRERHAPILLLTARDAVADRVAGLDAGADDYVVKPFSLAELQARVRALTRRAGRHPSSPLVVGDLWLDPVSRTVRRAERDVALSPREFALLEVLMRDPGHAVARRRIVDAVWGSGAPSTSNVVDVYVRYLREKVDRPFDRRSIQTVRGEGYRIVDDAGDDPGRG